MNGAIEEIIKINQADDPDDPDAYTEEWVMNMCSKLRETPEEFLAKMKANRAAVSLIDQEAFKIKSDKKALEDPEYFEYMTGPIDGLSYRLMKKSEGVDNVDSSKQ
jgi:hypothetical protein